MGILLDMQQSIIVMDIPLLVNTTGGDLDTTSLMNDDYLLDIQNYLDTGFHLRELSISVQRMTRKKVSGSLVELSSDGDYWYVCDSCGRGNKCMRILRPHTLQCEIQQLNGRQTAVALIASAPRDPLLPCPATESEGENMPVAQPQSQRSAPKNTYACRICKKTFKHSSNLKRHEAMHKENQTKLKYRCSICGKGHFYPSALRWHELRHQENQTLRKNMYRFYGDAYSYPGQLKRDQGTQDTTKTFAPDPLAPSSRAIKNSTHSQPSTPPRNFKHSCSICSKSFRYPSAVRRHELIHQGNSSLVQCPECPLQFRPDRLMSHMKAVHPSHKSKSRFCGRLFRNPRQRDNHDVAHRRKGICLPPLFTDAKAAILDFRTPVVIQHWDKRLLKTRRKCPYCPRTYRAKCSLNFHVSQHHKPNGGTVPINILTDGPTSAPAVVATRPIPPTDLKLQLLDRDRRYLKTRQKCPHCPRTYLVKRDLNFHISRAHQPNGGGTAPIDIILTDAPAAAVATTRPHLSTPHTCLSNGAPTDLKSNERTRFNCPFPSCLATYLWKCNLATHIKMYHPEEIQPESICTDVSPSDNQINMGSGSSGVGELLPESLLESNNGPFLIKEELFSQPVTMTGMTSHSESGVDFDIGQMLKIDVEYV